MNLLVNEGLIYIYICIYMCACVCVILCLCVYVYLRDLVDAELVLAENIKARRRRHLRAYN